MIRIRHLLDDALDALSVRAHMHVGPLVGAAVALLSDLLFASNAQAQILIALGVAILAREVIDWAAAGKRRECQRAVALTARALLDQHLAVTRIDRVQLGDWMTPRRLAAIARAGELQKFTTFGGPCLSIAESMWELISTFEREVGRCYGKLRPKGQANVDAFASALRRAGTAARLMANSPRVPPEDYEREAAGLFRELAIALQEVEAAANALDFRLDEAGAHAAAETRAAIAAERRSRERRALEVLITNARAAIAALGIEELDRNDVAQLEARLRRARDIALNVDAAAFREATDEARAAHRRIAYEDLFDALEAVQKVGRGATNNDAAAKIEALLERLPEDLAALERLSDADASGTAVPVPTS